MKKNIVFFVLILIASGLQAQETASGTLRKGIHLGAHVTPGFGTILTEYYDNLALDFGMTAGVDMNIYFSDLMGVHTGVTYMNLPWRYKFELDGISGDRTKEISATVKAIGIPMKYLLTTGKNIIGFYLEAGFSLYFPVSYKSDRDKQVLETVSVMFAPELTAGMSIKASDKISFSVSGFSSSQLPVFSNIDNISTGILYGLKMGMMVRLTK